MSANDERIVLNLSDDELTAIGLLGPAAAEQVKNTIEVIRTVPKWFQWLTVFHLQCLLVQAVHRPDGRFSPTSSTSSNATALSHWSDTTAVEPEFVSLFERTHFYTGLSDNPPPLFQRSDVLNRPFVVPKGRHSVIPDKTAHGVFDQVLTPALWRSTVGPEIVALLKDKKRGLRASSMVPVRFSIPDDEGKPVFDRHIVIWISVRPNTTTEAACRDANSDILAILEKYGVKDAAVHWIEGIVEPLVGPAMMSVVDETDPTAYIRRAMTGVLGVPLAAQEMADDDSQGSLGIYFYESEDKNGHKSEKVFAITNKHVVSKVTNTDYEFGRAGAPKKYIRCCDARRFQQVQNETRALIAEKLNDATRMGEQLAKLEAKPKSDDAEEVARDKRALKRKEQDLENVEEDIGTLRDFLSLINSTWSDAYQRFIGWVDWAPMIRNDVDQRCYTRDIGVIALDKAKWQKAFKGNYVYLGGKFTQDEITAMFYPNAANPPSFKYPSDHLFRLQGCVTAEGLATPYFYDEEGNPCYIVAKDGQTTGLTFGRFSECEAYTCDEFENDSWEVAVFNFDRRMGNFSDKGDSGSCIFNAEGKMVAILHSGQPRGLFNHVTYGTPAHFVVDQIKERYPKADFGRDKI